MSVAEITILPATMADVEELAGRLRATDVDEIEAASGLPPLQALRRSFVCSTRSWAGRADGDLVALFGVCPLSWLAGIGAPWLLASAAVERHQMAFLRRSQHYLIEIFSMYPTLRNWVDVRNATSIGWLRWLGFTIRPPVPFGPRGLPFHPFDREA